MSMQRHLQSMLMRAGAQVAGYRYVELNVISNWSGEVFTNAFEIQLYRAADGINRALNAQVAFTPEDFLTGYPPTNLVDGIGTVAGERTNDKRALWYPTSLPTSITLDLSQQVVFDRLRIYGGPLATRDFKSFTLSGSNNQITWDLLLSVASAPQTTAESFYTEWAI
ncbi:hypothetical protein [Thiocapsa sp.]|uniref:hypothetical protein n=1 Tax=Thiocapsa sp. TaxID=2024551 RepID=UPI0025F86E03|nr:hypothetical protein [Thiocapsa sp.]